MMRYRRIAVCPFAPVPEVTAMGLFISYSSQDRSAIEPLTTALRRARQQVWFDEELGGGQAWWNEILERIRSCEVFIVALSNRLLESKPCQAELRYARALERPILPVQIGPVDSMRANPLAALQVIDYQHPTADTGIQLVTAIQALVAQQPPLPSPLPDEPPVPFGYLMRLSTTLAEQDLDPRQQTHLLTELKSGLEEDGDDPTARNDIARLLRKLRDRSDVTYRTRTEIEELLASVDTKAAAPDAATVAARPQHEHPVVRPTTPVTPPAGPRSAPGATPPPQPPKTVAARPQPTRPSVPPTEDDEPSHKRWLIAGAAGLAVVVAIVAAVLFFTSQPSPTPSSAPAGPPPVDLDSILLQAADLSTILGVANLEPKTHTSQMVTSPGMPSNTACLGAFEPIQAAAYQDSGYTAVRGLGFRSPEPPKRVFEAAVEFPSAEKAHAFVRKSAGNWRACAGQTVTVTDGNRTIPWMFAELNGAPPRIVQRRSEVGAEGRVCQRVLSAVSRVVIDVVACGPSITNEAGQVADQMAAKVTP
jgi:serine/threonine kinase PknH